MIWYSNWRFRYRSDLSKASIPFHTFLDFLSCYMSWYGFHWCLLILGFCWILLRVIKEMEVCLGIVIYQASYL